MFSEYRAWKSIKDAINTSTDGVGVSFLNERSALFASKGYPVMLHGRKRLVDRNGKPRMWRNKSLELSEFCKSHLQSVVGDLMARVSSSGTDGVTERIVETLIDVVQELVETMDICQLLIQQRHGSVRGHTL